jgi:predicted RNase H-like HicB family nuclease
MQKTNLKSPFWNIVWKEGKYYVSQCLNVDVSSFGTTKKKALENLNEALELYFEDDRVTSSVAKIDKPEVFLSTFHYA